MTRQRRTKCDLLVLRIDGGCNDCAAWTDRIEYGGDVFSIVVSHDATCPHLAALRKQQ